MQYVNSFKPSKLVKQGQNQSIQVELPSRNQQAAKPVATVKAETDNSKSKKTKEK